MHKIVPRASTFTTLSSQPRGNFWDLNLKSSQNIKYYQLLFKTKDSKAEWNKKLKHSSGKNLQHPAYDSLQFCYIIKIIYIIYNNNKFSYDAAVRMQENI